MTTEIQVLCTLKLDLSEEGKVTPIFVSSNIIPPADKGLSHLLNKEGLPTKQGAAAMSTILVESLVLHIHYCEQSRIKESPAMLREVITRLEDGFAEVTNLIKIDRIQDLSKLKTA